MRPLSGYLVHTKKKDHPKSPDWIGKIITEEGEIYDVHCWDKYKMTTKTKWINMKLFTKEEMVKHKRGNAYEGMEDVD